MELNDKLTDHFRLIESQRVALKRLKVETIEDLLFHFPSRYENISNTQFIKNLESGDQAIVYGTLEGLKAKKAYKTKMNIAEGYIRDNTGRIKLTWFNQPYIAKMYKDGANVRIAGKVAGKDSLYLSNPEVTVVDEIPADIHESLFHDGEKVDVIYPIYSESRGITSKWMYHTIQKIFADGTLDGISDPINESLLKKYNLPTRSTAFVWIHTPQREADALAARKRFAFEEVFFIQLIKQAERCENKKRESLHIDVDQEKIKEFMERFPFELTKAQNKAITNITEDLNKEYPMSRLLEGDVGSGKTAVAASTMYSVVTTRPGEQDFGNLQVAYMAPTEILAKQLFQSLIEYFEHLPIQIGLITSSGCRKFPSKINPSESTKISKPQLLKWVENGEVPIVIGTHSLIQKTVKFKNLAYVIIDEQHRFGTLQRQKLLRKDELTPHLLSMTATPIPRTLALTIYGDLDLTLLDEMPHGRKPIITEVVTPNKRDATYEKIKKELEEGRQVYVICPRIDEPDPDKQMALNVKSVKAEAKRLSKDVFPDYEIDILHSKMKPAEKEEIMNDFENHEIDILVATSVVEVGVNVPNATVIIIEGAERFGLAQLHQLRGRVIRSNHQAYCYAFADAKSKTTIDRLNALKTAKNGFELAEFDLKIRGAGELYGKKQWGLTDVGMEAIKNLKMVEAARKEASEIIEKDPTLKNHPVLKEIASARKEALHFE